MAGIRCQLSSYSVTILILITGYIFQLIRYSEGKEYSLLQREDVVPVQISNGPYDNNYEKHYEACTVVY